MNINMLNSNYPKPEVDNKRITVKPMVSFYFFNKEFKLS